MTTQNRRSKFERVAARRQEMTVVLENVHDPHNIGAVLRSCDAVGIDEIFVLYTEDHLDFERLEKIGTSATGVKKWMKIHCFRSVEECFKAVRASYDSILATHLNAEAEDVYAFDLTQRVAFLFGNEHEGLTEEALKHADANIVIPQMGMAQSLNISVACAVTIYEALRQRSEAGMYPDNAEGMKTHNEQILKRYLDIHEASYKKE